jgi:lysophospholipase L1-like esterase
MTAPGNLWTDTKSYPPRHDIIYSNYLTLKNEGDENVYFVDGLKFFPQDLRSECTVDGVHPNDLGFSFMAKALLPIIKDILKI